MFEARTREAAQRDRSIHVVKGAHKVLHVVVLVIIIAVSAFAIGRREVHVVASSWGVTLLTRYALSRRYAIARSREVDAAGFKPIAPFMCSACPPGSVTFEFVVLVGQVLPFA